MLMTPMLVSINVVLCHQFQETGQDKILKPRQSPTVQCPQCPADIPQCSVPCVLMTSHSAVTVHPKVQCLMSSVHITSQSVLRATRVR